MNDKLLAVLLLLGIAAIAPFAFMVWWALVAEAWRMLRDWRK